jgi:phosphatidylglycerophosphate synthase
VRLLGIFIFACLAIVALVLLTRDPEEPWAVAVVILSTAGAAGGVATLVQLRRTGGGRRRASEGRTADAARRGIEIAAAVALLLWLRALDGLSLLTAAFVVATFVVAEVVLSARPHSSR